ncbi:hypothetical protein PF008_g32148, partial [Phytophthora fragariae]
TLSSSGFVIAAKSANNTTSQAAATVGNLTAESRKCLRSPRRAAEAVNSILGGISARDVRQQAGRTYANAGEVLPSGVARILDAVGPLGEDDIFLDVGASVGNIVAQVALATDAKKCIGVELRKDLVALGQCCVQQHLKHQPLLDANFVRDIARRAPSPIASAGV